MGKFSKEFIDEVLNYYNDYYFLIEKYNNFDGYNQYFYDLDLYRIKTKINFKCCFIRIIEEFKKEKKPHYSYVLDLKHLYYLGKL